MPVLWTSALGARLTAVTLRRFSGSVRAMLPVCRSVVRPARVPPLLPLPLLLLPLSVPILAMPLLMLPLPRRSRLLAPPPVMPLRLLHAIARLPR